MAEARARSRARICPYIHPDQARELIERAADLLVTEFGYERAADRPRPGKGNGNGAEQGAADWQYLCDRIRAGEALHDSLRDLAAKLVASGMEGGAAVNFLRSLMKGLSYVIPGAPAICGRAFWRNDDE